MSLNLSELRAFGEDAQQLKFPSVAPGGFIVPGPESATNCILGKEESSHGRKAREGPETRAGKEAGIAPEAAAPGPPAHALGPISPSALVEELRDYGAPITVARSSGRFAQLRLPVGLFQSLPVRAELMLEVPLITRRQLRVGLSSIEAIVPDVRAWSWWTRGMAATGLIRSHHQYPDRSMCVCLTIEWRLGRDSLITYVDYCVMWIAKVLHDQLVGFYPGRQHYGEKVRVERDRMSEYCGCGGLLPYSQCHRDADQALSTFERNRRHFVSQQAYLAELDHQDRSRELPF